MQRNTFVTVLSLAPFIFTFAFGLDVYLPSIPDIRLYFDTSPFVMQLTVSFFLLFTGIGQLLVGPLSDNFGRRRIIIGGTLIFLLGCVLASVAMHVTTLIVARMIQGFGACSMMVGTFAMVRDLYNADECARIYSFLNSTISLSPLVAPIIGGYLAEAYGWRSAFIFLSIMALIITLQAWLLVKESLIPQNRVRLTRIVFTNYLHIAKHHKFQVYTFCAGSGFASFLTFFSVSSYLLITLLHISKAHFGFYFGTIGVVFFIGSLLSGHLAKKIGTHKTVLSGTILMITAGIVMFLWYMIGGLSPAAFMGPMMIMGIGGSMLMGAGAGGAIEPFPDMAGAASAVFGFFQFVFAFIVSTFVLEWKVTSTLPLAFTMIILGVAALIGCCFFRQVCQSLCPEKNAE